jgi:dTMP kinase
MASTGTFVVVEGPDGAGKTTLVKRLGERLRSAGVEVVEVREPGGTEAAEHARKGAFDPSLDASPLAELFFVLAARADLVTKVIQPALAASRFVLSDRYELSTEAYQVHGRGLPRDAVLAANALATGGLKPDLTLVLDLPAPEGRSRQVRQGKNPDRMEREDLTLHQRVADVFREARGERFVHVDASRSPEEVAHEAWQVLETRFPKLSVGRRVESAGAPTRASRGSHDDER